MLAVALSFWTWHRLKTQGLDDDGTADLMTDAVVAAGDAPVAASL